MGQNHSLTMPVTNGSIHPKDKDRTMDFEINNVNFGKWDEFERKYNIDKDPKNTLTTQPGSIIRIVKNDPNLVTKVSWNWSGKLAWQQCALMKCTNILYYKNVFQRPNSSIYGYVMEKLNYTLTEYILKKNCAITFNEEDCKLIMFDILNCLYSIHLAHFIHTDIKPLNIMYRSRDFIGADGILYKKGWVIIDYDTIRRRFINGGYWVNCISLDEVSTTPGWCAPEFGNKNKISSSSDLFSCGLIILFILFKKQPLEPSTKFKIKYLWKNEFKPILSENKLIKYLLDLKHSKKISYNLYNLLRGLLHYDRKKRIKSVKDAYNSPWFDSIRNTNVNGEK